MGWARHVDRTFARLANTYCPWSQRLQWVCRYSFLRSAMILTQSMFLLVLHNAWESSREVTHFWNFVIRAVLWALAELPIEGIPGTNLQQLPSISLASLVLQRGFWKRDRQAIFTRAPLSSSSKHSQRSRHGRIVRCPGLIESIISILIIHLKLIKANLGMQECQAKQKVVWCYYVVASYNSVLSTSWTPHNDKGCPSCYFKWISGQSHTSVSDSYSEETHAIVCILNVSQRLTG